MEIGNLSRRITEVDLAKKEFRVMILKISKISEKDWRHRLRRHKKYLTKT